MFQSQWELRMKKSMNRCLVKDKRREVNKVKRKNKINKKMRGNNKARKSLKINKQKHKIKILKHNNNP